MQSQTNTQADERRAYRVNEVIACYRIGRTLIYRLIGQGKLRTVKIGGRRLIPKDAIEALLNGGAQ